MFEHFKKLLEKEIKKNPSHDTALIYLDLIVGYVDMLEKRTLINDQFNKPKEESNK